MAYIGREPQIGNFQVCDAISTVNAQAAYTMQVGGVNVSPETANHMLVSLNGIIQAPTSSFTVSGSTITFAANLVTGDVINFIQILGSVLDLGVPSDSTVSIAKLTATGTKNSTTFLRGDNTFAAPSAAGLNLISTSTTSSGVSEIDITSGIDNTYTQYMISIINLHPASDSTLRIRFFTASGIDTGSNYRTSMIGFRNDRTSEISHGASGSSYFDAFNQNIGADADESFSANLFLVNPASTTFDTILHGDFAQIDDAGRIAHGIVGGRYLNTGNAITGLRFYQSTGNIDNAIIKIYGIS